MIKFPCLPTALLALSAPLLPAFVRADDNQAFFAILAETKVSKMAGFKMPAMHLPPGVKLPPGAMAGMAMASGAPVRSLNVRLWSPSIAPDGATAFVTPPDGLLLGNRLDLELYRPKPEQTTAYTGEPGSGPESNPDFTIKIYWGSSPTVKDGQPKIIHFGDFTPEQKDAMHKRMAEAHAAGATSYFYKPGWTTGYWPTQTQPGAIADGASLLGKYSLTTSYTGNVDIEAPAGVDFLAPINITAPDLSEKPDLTAAIPFKWDPIPNVLGQYATIMGMEGKNTLILWSSSEVYQDRMMADMGYLQMAEVRDLVSQTVFMDGARTQATVPAGIFGDCDFVMMNMAGYGPGAALDKAQPLPRIQTKTTLSVMLGGKKMPARGPMGGGDSQ